MVKKKGIIFSLEAAIALGIFISAFAFLLLFNIENASPYKRFERLNIFVKDSLEVMSQMEVGDLIDDVDELKRQYDLGNIENTETSVIEVIGTFWSEGDIETAEKISQQVLEKIIPSQVKYRLSIEDQEIYSSAVLDASVEEVSQSSKLVSGLSPTQSSTGFVARAFLEKIKSKTFSSYTYFGGFVGQGDVTVLVNDIPATADPESIYVEMSLRRDADLYINDVFCQKIDRSGSQFDIVKTTINNPTCIDAIEAESDNLLKFDFTAQDISEHFISGGFLRIDYVTDVAAEPQVNTIRYKIPGIDGLINLYDSFYVPGELQTMNVHLEFMNKLETFMTIGNEVVLTAPENENPQVIDISDATLSSQLNYDTLSNNNVPFRIGFDLLQTQGDADVILITDLSGSMNFNFNEQAKGKERNCDDSDLLDPTTKRISLAKCLDIEFVNRILSIPGNKIALVGFDGQTACVKEETELTNDITLLTNEIQNYVPLGPTCIACGINKAYEILQESDPSRQRFIVVMTDGVANVYTSLPNGFTPADGISETCSGACNPTGSNYVCFKCGTDDANTIAGTQTVDASCRANDDLGAIVYSIGFDVTADCNYAKEILDGVAICGNTIQSKVGSTPTDLEGIYDDIVEEILERNYQRQKVILSGDVEMSLSPNSYIEITFTPEETAPLFGGISINVETDTFDSCEGTFLVPNDFRVDKIHVTSYSGDYWTDDVKFRDNDASGTPWQKVFLLSDFGTTYTQLGDPFNVEIPINLVKSGRNNQVDVRTGSGQDQQNPQCTKDNRVIYTATISALTSFSPVLQEIEGNVFKVYYNKGNFDCTPEGSLDVEVGTPISSTPLNVGQADRENNALHYAFTELLNKLNYVDDGCEGASGSDTNPIDIEMTPELEIVTTSLSNVPSLWGPVKFSLITWA